LDYSSNLGQFQRRTASVMVAQTCRTWYKREAFKHFSAAWCSVRLVVDEYELTARDTNGIMKEVDR
jgi:hypothetical protein